MSLIVKKTLNKKRKYSKRKPCMFCLEKMEYIDYKNIEIIKKKLVCFFFIYYLLILSEIKGIKAIIRALLIAVLNPL